MRIVSISDTHGKHKKLVDIPDGDIIIHAGDVCNRGTMPELKDFVDWFTTLPHKHKIFIPGNHDRICEAAPQRSKTIIPRNINYLNDSGIEISGLKIWGSPISPYFFNWAFNRFRGDDIKKHWDIIPRDTDILIVHGPPYGFGDKVVSPNLNEDPCVGCKDLAAAIEIIKPKLVVAGHIHEGYSVLKKEKTTYVNASVLDERYTLVNDPVIIDL